MTEPRRIMKRGFTLIELLIVVAIIAILAAIAVPNFLEAQVRAKVSRVKSDQRSVGVALEAYYVDNNKYPPMGDPAVPGRIVWFLPHLTTPVSYLSNDAAMNDPFLINTTAYQVGNLVFYNQRNMFYANFMQFGPIVAQQPPNVRFNAWSLNSWGPDHFNDGFAFRCYNVVNTNSALWTLQQASNGTYDPTNGTVSGGDVGKFGGEVPPIVGVITSFK